MRLWLVSLDYSLPTLQAYLSARGAKPLDPAAVQATAETLRRCIETGELLVSFAVSLAGRPCRQ
jgi:hypothetical protein